MWNIALFRTAALLLTATISLPADESSCLIETFAQVGAPYQIKEGPDGSIYVRDLGLAEIRRIDRDGTVSTAYYFGFPTRLESDFDVDSTGDLFLSQSTRVLKIRRDGSQTVFAGSLAPGCRPGSCRVGDPATRIGFRDIDAVELDSAGNVWILGEDSNSFRQVFRIDQNGLISHVFDVGEATRLHVDALDRAHVAHRQWLILTADGSVTVEPNLSAFAPDPGAYSVARDGTAYYVPFGAGLYAVSRLAPGAIYDPLAGAANEPGYAGDGGPPLDARFDEIRGMLLASDGSLYLSDRNNGRVRRIRNPEKCPTQGPRPLPAVLGMTNGASFSYNSITPGTVFALFGIRLGPTAVVTADLDAQGRLPTELAGYRVLIDGIPAPLLYVSEGQVGGIVPFETPVAFMQGPQGSTTQVGDRPDLVVQGPSGRSDPLPINTSDSAPNVFSLNGSGNSLAAALNQDGTLHTAANPAPRGSIVVMWATGFGLLQPTPEDGAIQNRVLPAPLLGVTASVDFEPAEVLYAASAPGMAAGVMQVNLRVPSTLEKTGELRVRIDVGNAWNQSQTITIFVAP